VKLTYPTESGQAIGRLAIEVADEGRQLRVPKLLPKRLVLFVVEPAMVRRAARE
jgi:hypothetical protein